MSQYTIVLPPLYRTNANGQVEVIYFQIFQNTNAYVKIHGPYGGLLTVEPEVVCYERNVNKCNFRSAFEQAQKDAMKLHEQLQKRSRFTTELPESCKNMEFKLIQPMIKSIPPPKQVKKAVENSEVCIYRQRQA